MRNHLLITAFGPFGGFEVNPSTSVLELLEKEGLGPEVSFVTLPVCYREVKAFVDGLKDNPPERLIHLGVAGGSEVMRLEMCAVNQAEGPDVEGVDPEGSRLFEGPDSIQTTADPSRLQSFQETHAPAVQISEDAGRYLCNALYYQSLNALGVPHGTRCLFVHVADPEAPGALCSIAEQVAWIKELVQEICC